MRKKQIQEEQLDLPPLTLEECKRGDTVFWARETDNELYECTIRTIDDTMIIIVDKKSHMAFAISKKYIGTSVFRSRNECLGELKRRKLIEEDN